MGKKMDACRRLVGKPEGKGPLERPRRRWLTALRASGWEDVDWIDVAEVRDNWQTF
jgi:hypothetical protein